MAMAIFSQALREYVRFRRIAPWMLLGLLCYATALFWPHLIPNSPPEARYANVSSLLVFRLLALASAIFTTAIISQEVEGRTIVYLLTRPTPRWMLLLTRYLASVIVVCGLGCFAAWLTSVGAYGGVASNSLLASDIRAIAVGALAYGALFLLVSLVVNRAMVYCLLFAFGWETSVPNLQGDLYRVSIYSYLQGIAQHPATATGKALGFITGALSGNSITPLTAYLTLGGLVAVCLAISAWVFTHFEFVPREDVE